MSIDRGGHQKEETAPDCSSEGETLAYFAGELSGERLERAESHLVECDTCRETLAMLARMTSQELSPEDARLAEEVAERTATAARKMFPGAAKEEPPRERASTRWLALAASIVLAGSIGLAIWLARPAKNPDVDLAMKSLKSATSKKRPAEMRVTGLEYAEYREVRSGNRDNEDLLDNARALLEHAVAKNPTPDARHALGRVLIATNDHTAAIAQLELARQASPRDVGILTDLAVARAGAGDAKSAEADLDRALEIDPSNQEALFNRALLRQRTGRPDEALADFERYLQLDPGSPWAAEARQRLNDLAK